MKKLLLILILAGIIIPYSCSKRYEEDPFTMKFISLKKRISGEWHMKKILIDGQDFSHLIEMENDTFFSVYNIYDFRKSTHFFSGKMEIKTKNGKYILDKNAHYDFSVYSDDINNFNYVSFNSKSSAKIKPYGPINKFNTSGGPVWLMKKLTKKNMHLSTNFQNQYYELFFEKKK